MLVLNGRDEVRGLDFHRAIGGGIEFGERAEDALRREFMEELGVHVEHAELLGVYENIFVYEGEPAHEIAHIYAVHSAEIDALPLDARLHVLDEGSPVNWVAIDDIRAGIRPLFPSGAPEELLSLAGSGPLAGNGWLAGIDPLVENGDSLAGPGPQERTGGR